MRLSTGISQKVSFRLTFTCAFLVVLVIGMLPLSVQAQTKPPVVKSPPANHEPPQAVASFIIPASADPDSVTFSGPGDFEDITDQNDLITGKVLDNDPNVTGAGKGLNVLQAATSGVPFTPIVEVDFFTTYTGALEIDSTVPQGTNLTPWNIKRIVPLFGYEQGFGFYRTDPLTQAALGTSIPTGSFLAASLIDPNDPSGFLDARFATIGYASIQDNAVPEPGSIAFFGGILAWGAGLLYRRIQSRR